MKISAPAKINLVLEVLGRRADGFHEIRNIMQTVGWNDHVLIQPDKDIVLECSQRCLESQENLVWRAANLLRLQTGITAGATIYLKKRIPEAAGLGGGSSDASATLLALNRFWKLGLSKPHLMEIAGHLGSDVPYFIEGGLAMAEGKGEIVKPFHRHLKRWVIIAMPPVKIPARKTKVAYQALRDKHFTDGTRYAKIKSKIHTGEGFDASDIYNVFDEVAEVLYPGIRAFQAKLEGVCNCVFHLAGAGPAIYAICSNRLEARKKITEAAGSGHQLKACAFCGGPEFQ